MWRYASVIRIPRSHWEQLVSSSIMKSNFYLKDLVTNTTKGYTFPSLTTSMKVDLMEFFLSVES